MLRPVQASTRSAWFCAVVALLAVPVGLWVPAFGVQWACLWLGLAAFFVGARRRFPRFVGLPAAAYLGALSMSKDEIEGPVLVPWYLLIIIGTVWLCTMMVPMMIIEPGVLVPYGIGIALTLGGGAYWLSRRQRESAAAGRALAGNPGPGRTLVRAEVSAPDRGLRRHLHWFGISGVRHGTERIETADGRTMDVATATPTHTTYGFRQEDRLPLRLQSEDGSVTVETHGALWASPRRALPTAPPLRGLDPSSPRGIMVHAFVGSANYWEEELIGRGDRVLVVGTFDPTERRITGTSDRPVLIFGVDGERDPLGVLRAELWQRRWPMIAQIVLALVAVAAPILA